MKKGEILKAIQDYKGFKTKSAFAGYLDIKANVLSNWFSRDSFDEELLLEKIPELNRVWLLTGEGEMLKNITKDEVKPVPYENYMEVEYAKLSTVAGKLGFENPATLPETRKKLIPREFDSGNYLVVEVDGDSMDDGTNISIPDGSDILIKEYMLNAGEKLPIRGNLFVIVTTEGTVFKQIVEHNIEEGYIMCHSYNPKYKDYKINVVDIIQIFIYRKIVSVRPSIPEI